MRTVPLNTLADIAVEMFERYVEPNAVSMMCGEVPSVQISVHRRGTKDKDWLARVTLKNTLMMSVLRCDLWLEDMFRFARMSRLWLITEEVFRMVSLYGMLQPVLQFKHIDFTENAHHGYDSMMSDAGEETYSFVVENYSFPTPIEIATLNALRRTMMEYTNHWIDTMADEHEYENLMLQHHRRAYLTARRFKANTGLVGHNGHILLEKREQ